MQISYQYFLIKGFENGYFAMNAFPKEERREVFRTLAYHVEIGTVREFTIGDRIFILTETGELHRKLIIQENTNIQF